MKYKKNSIFYKYFKKFGVLLFIPIFILFAVVYYLAFMQNYAGIISDLNNLNSNYNNELNNRFSYIYKISEDISLDNNVKWFIASENITDNDTIEAITKINNSFRKNMMMVPYIKAVHLYGTYSNYVISTSNAGYLDGFYKKEIIDNINNKSDYTCFYTDNEDSCIDIAIPSYSFRKLKAVLIITVDKEIFTKNMPLSDVYACDLFVSADGERIFSTIDEDLSQSFLYKKFITPIQSFDLVVESNYDITNPLNIKLYVVMLLMVIIGSIIISFITAAVMSEQYYRSVSEIIVKYDGVFITDAQKDELENISYNIMHLVNTNKKISDELSEKLSVIQDTQLRLMQAQINPHFLFNTLNSISVYIAANCSNSEIPLKLITLLSDIAHNALDINLYYTTIGEEIEYTKKYIEIERLKNSEKFDAVWTVQEDLLRCKTIKFIMQPVVENAIRYGFRPRFPEFGGTIYIKIYREDNKIVIQMNNNGIPIEADKAQEINQRFNGGAIPTEHIGLVNTVLRIKTYYGKEYGGVVKSERGGTSVTFVIPYEQI